MNPSRKSSYSHYDFITKFIPNGGFIIQEDSPALTYKFISEGYAAMLGYTVQELMEVSRGSVNSIVDCLGKEEEIDEFNASSEVGAEYLMQYKLRCKDGSWKLVEDRGCKVQNENGETEYWSVVIDVDASARLKEAQDALERVHQLTEEQESQIEEITALNRELEERQAQLEESTAEQESQLEEISTINADLGKKSSMLEQQLGIIGSIAKTFQALYTVDMTDYSFVELGTSRALVETVIGRKGNAKASFEAMCNYLVIPEQKAEMEAFTDVSTLQVRLADKPFISHQYCGKNGVWSEGSFVAVSRNEAGLLTCVLWGVRNIDDFKQKEIKAAEELTRAKEEAESANKAKSTFLFNMSHDIRTPMNAITGFTALIRKYHDDPEKLNDYLGKVESSSQFLLSLINNVLEMARIESGNTALDETTWSTEQFNDTLVSVFTEQMRQKDISFTRSIHVQHPYVYCDTVKLQKIFLNIISNAYKYTPNGGTVSMALVELPSEKEGYAKFQTTISDTGIGMSKEYLPHIFEEFSREKTVTDNRIEGTGLGMPIVKQLVELMGGTITVQSELGKGTTFVVTMYHRISDENHLKKPDIIQEIPASFAGKRILLAEDNDLNAEIAMEILTEVGFLVDRALDGIFCVDMLTKEPAGYYDLILMDIQMPNLNGYETARRVRSLSDTQKALIPILAMTANAFEEDKREALRSGMDGHLAKPINVTELMKALAGILG